MFMRIFFSGILLLCLSFGMTLAQIPNSGFESWLDGDPVGWATSNVPSLITNITRTSTAHSDSYAVRGDVISYYKTALNPVLQSGPGGEGFAYNQRPAYFTGYYEFFPTGGDRLAINVGLNKGGIDGSNVAIAAATPSATVSSFTQFSVPFVYYTAETPDTCIVQIQIVGPSLSTDYHVGSYFILDDIGFSGTVNIDEKTEGYPANIHLAQNYPNPFNSNTIINYQLTGESRVILNIYNMLGQEIMKLADEVQGAGYKSVDWNAAGVASGIYFYKLEVINLSDPGKSFSQLKKMSLLK